MNLAIKSMQSPLHESMLYLRENCPKPIIPDRTKTISINIDSVILSTSPTSIQNLMKWEACSSWPDFMFTHLQVYGFFICRGIYYKQNTQLSSRYLFNSYLRIWDRSLKSRYLSCNCLIPPSFSHFQMFPMRHAAWQVMLQFKWQPTFWSALTTCETDWTWDSCLVDLVEIKNTRFVGTVQLRA